MFVFPYLTYFSSSLFSLDPSMLLQMERLHFLMAEFYVVMYVCVYIYMYIYIYMCHNFCINLSTDEMVILLSYPGNCE